MTKELFNELYSINVQDKTEKKNNLTYLSWAWAWAEFVKRCPEAKYEIRTFDGKPYLYDEKLGYMVFTSITVDGDTKEMWLPVMDNNNRSMKDHPYKYKMGQYERTVEAASMFDINKAIMRCLTKNISMFGLGLYIYAGEDLPEEPQKSGIFDDRLTELAEEFRRVYSPGDQKRILETNKATKAEDLGEIELQKYINIQKYGN